MEEVVNKIDEMQKYIPCLKLLIKNLEDNPAKSEQVKKMKYLLEMLTKKDKSIKLETLVKCEDILMKVYDKEQILAQSTEEDSQNENIVEVDSEPETINGPVDTDTAMIISNDRDSEISVQDSEKLINGVAGTEHGKIRDSISSEIDPGVVVKLPQENGSIFQCVNKSDSQLQDKSILKIVSVQSGSLTVSEPASNVQDSGECDMEIDEELTSSNVSKVIDKQLSVVEQNGSSGNKGPILNEKPPEPVGDANQKVKAGFVDLTSDDSDTDTSPAALPAKTTQSTFTSIPTVKPAPIILNSIVARKKTPLKPKMAVVPLKDPLEIKKPKVIESRLPNIVTIDLDSDSEDESSPKLKSITESSRQMKMPSPKIDKPMFTIASVQSISTMQAQHDKKRQIEGNLHKLVKATQYTTHHTVPQKYNEKVRKYLESFVRNLMNEKNRVNLCLQRLQKVLSIDTYKDVKRVIQSYCSEPVNDSSLPAPSPFCHRIKVFPEKLQFVMRNLFFFGGAISVIGYQVYNLVNHNKVNGVIKTYSTSLPKPNTAKSVENQTNRQFVRKSTSIPTVNSNVVFAEAWKPSTVQTTIIRNAPPPLIEVPAAPEDDLLAPMKTQNISREMPACSEEDLLAPMKTQNISREDTITPQKQKQRRRKRTSSDNDDDDDENYVPQEYISDPDDTSESLTSSTRRTSLQRASKIRCQRYLELERTIDDETYIRATEANLTQALRGQPKTQKATQPSPSKSKSVSRSKKKREILLSDSNADDTNPDCANHNDDEEGSSHEDNQPAKRRRTGELQNAVREPEDEIDDDYESSSELDPEQVKSGKNIVRAYHCRSKYISRCLICTDRLNRKTRISHYVNNHPNCEVMLSRVTASDVMKLQSGAMSFAFLSAAKGAVNTYVAYCIFCQGESCMSLRNWYEHYTRHTGEYGYQCSACLSRRSCLQQIKRHANVECTKENPTVVKLFEIDPEIDRIDAYVCLICNYVQLFFDNIFRHLQAEHELQDISVDNIPTGTYQTVNLLQVDQRYENESGENVDDLQYIDENAQDDMSYLICNMLADGQVQTNVGTDQETNHSMTESYSKCSIDYSTQSPETSIREFLILKSDVVNSPNTEEETIMKKFGEEKVKFTVDDTSAGVDEAKTEPVTIYSTVDIIDEIKSEPVTTNTSDDVEVMLPSTSEKDGDIVHATNSCEASNERERENSPKLQSLGNKNANQIVEDRDKVETKASQILSEEQSTHVDDAKLEITKSTSESTNFDNESETSQIPSVRGECSRDSSVIIISEQDESGVWECLAQSATEGVFKNIIDSMIESAEITLSSESSSELPEQAAIEVGIRSELTDGTSDSTDSGPQFLTSTTTPVLVTVTETNEPMETASQIEEFVVDETVSVVDGNMIESSTVSLVITESDIVPDSAGEIFEFLTGDQLSESCDPESATISLSNEKTSVSGGENPLEDIMVDSIDLQIQAEPAASADQMMDAEETIPDSTSKHEENPNELATEQSDENDMKDLDKI